MRGPTKIATPSDRRPEIFVISVIAADGTSERSSPGSPAHFAAIPLGAIGLVRCKVSGLADGQVSIAVTECRAAGQAGMGEDELLSRFWQGVDAQKPQLATFGGRSFGLPYLRYRSLAHGLTTRHLAMDGAPLGIHPLADAGQHVDLMDCLSSGGVSAPPSMVDLCAVLGTGVDMSNPDLRHRAALEAAVIFMAYVRLQMFTGALSSAEHEKAINSLDAAIQKSPAFQEA